MRTLRMPTGIRVLGTIGALAALVILIAFGLLRILGPSERFTTFELPYTEDFQEVEIKRWFADSGVWSIRNETLAQITNLDDTAQIFIPKTMADDQFYHLSTYILLSSKTRSAGINFNAQYPKLTQNMHQLFLTRVPPEDGVDGQESDQTVEELVLIAGYTDDAGEFIPQVTVPIGEDATDYRLDLYVTGNTYAVQLNGQTLIENRPLFYPNGVIGFHSLGPVKFDSLTISTAEDARPSELVYTSDFEEEPGGAGWVPFAGNWKIQDEELVQTESDQREAGIGYEGASFENYVLQATLHHLEGTGGGLLFNMPSPYQVNGSHMVRFSDQTNSLLWGYYNEAGKFERQGYTDIQEIGAGDQRLRVYSDDSLGNYDIYLGEDLIARGIPLLRRTGHIGLVTSFSSVAYATVEVFPIFTGKSTAFPTLSVAASVEIQVQDELQVEEPEEATDVAQPPQLENVGSANVSTPGVATPLALAPDGSAPIVATPVVATPVVATPVVATPVVATPALPVILAGNSASLAGSLEGGLLTSGWKPLSRSWTIENDALVQSDEENLDQAIVYTPNAFRNYSYGVKLAHLKDSGAGILFNMPYSDRLNGAHMVRYSERSPGGMFWGYFDDDGIFVGQGYTSVDIPFNQRHELRIVSTESSYNVYLDNVLLVSDLQLRQNAGHVGLITSKSAASFTDPWIGGLQETVAAAPGQGQGAGERTAVSGEWIVNSGEFEQMSPNATDMLLNLGIYASNYVAEAAITLPDLPEAGGGFVIHMRDPSDIAGAFIVRLIRGGEGIFWGTYDEAGLFRGRGSEELTNNPDGTYQLKVTVQENSVDIYVDDQLVADDVLMPYAEGWIGLVAHTGPVLFQDVAIDVAINPKAAEQGATE